MRTAFLLGGLSLVAAGALILSGCGSGGVAAGTGDDVFGYDYGNGFSTRGRGAAVYSIPSTGTAVFVAAAGGDIDYLGFTPLSALFRNSKVAFSSNRAGDHDIYLMDYDGGNVVRLTSDADDERRPSISADGSKVYYDSSVSGFPQIYVVNADGTGKTRLTNTPASDYQPAVSPDGRYVAFVTTRAGGTDIYIMDPDGTGQKRLTYHSGADERPDISPDGLRICFISDRAADGRKHVWVMGIDGSNPVQVTSGAGSEADCRWSPDGTRIVFVNQLGWVYTIRSDGNDVRPVATNSPVRSCPAYSPDGQKILFSADLSGNNEMFAVNADGTGTPVRLTYDNAADLTPSVSGSRLDTRVFVGPNLSDRGRNPAFGLAVGGFIASLDGPDVGDVIGIDALVRGALYIDSLYLGTEAGLVGATIGGTVISKLMQDNGREFAPTLIIGEGGMYNILTDTVEVFFDADTGRLTSVVPLGRSRSQGGTGGDAFENGRYLVRGDVLAAIDVPSGKNLAGPGATEVSIDPSSGRIMGVR